MWSDLYQSLSVIPTREANVHCRPNDKLLDQFEVGNGLLLPKAYREFSKAFGAGELGGHYRIAVPGYPSRRPSWSPNILEMNQRWHSDDAEDAKTGSRDIAFYSSIFYFCETTEGEAIGWNLAESTDVDSSDFRIYLRMRSEVFVPLAESYADFVLSICLGDGYDRVMAAHGFVLESPSEISKTFVPASCESIRSDG